MAVHTPICDFGWTAPDFSLPATDGKTYALDDIRGPKGTLIVFICNHCPYVKAVVDRLARDAHALMDRGIGVAAISANDPEQYPEDSFDNMTRFAREHGFRFPYLHDASQDVARAYGAVCTPDFFGFDADLGLQYRGRLDSSGKQPAAPDVRRELFDAMSAVAETGQGPQDQIASMGCSIKWKAA
ncbi:thioredoxin family protein [Roseospira visakhapatnamensis]|uniref:Peroxiredoxin n=1 Tax=Roseospira visakhapatnamensis TaxID=390880 RepID=A0A7W6RH17_9PROT|nr:thioredoxin family protein [Roseospira visakhapatnamensis]MBB4268182.1 peroxiredoxin [Roseospira visakhapatnamensis]